MKPDFTVWPRQKGKTLHLYLSGSFDENSARMLTGVIDAHIGGFRFIHIHTRGVSMYHLNSWRLFLKDSRIRRHCGKDILISHDDRADLPLPGRAGQPVEIRY